MAPRAVAILALISCLGLPACGAHGTYVPGDASVDRQHDAGVDRPAEDAAPDGGQDTGPATAPSFLSQTSGGARLLSNNYRLELFVAPTPPPGSTAGSGYRLRLGPGALRNAR